jgi:hypothetical protein
MKSKTLFQLGGLAILIAAIIYAINNLIYLVTGQPQEPTAVGVWANFVGDTFLLLGLGALYARLAHRAGILGLIAYVLLVVGTLLFVGNYAVTLGVVAGAFTSEQVAQVPAYNTALAIMPWLWAAGLVAMGISIYRTGILPKYIGLAMVLLAVVQRLLSVAGFLVPVFMILSLVTFAWLGWALLRENRAAAPETIPAAA